MTNNKKGESIVEAAVVVPIIVLIIISMLYMLIYFYSEVKTQVMSHEALQNKAMIESNIFKIERDEPSVEGYIGGLIKKNLSSSFDNKGYIINPADGVRIKEGMKGVKE